MTGPVLYVERGAGMRDAVNASGHWLCEIDGVWVASDPIAVQHIIDNYDPAPVILSAIDTHARALRDAAVAGISPAEMAAWPIKLAQAQAGAGAMIEMEAAARGVLLDALIAKIIAKADAMATLEAHIAGVCGRHQDAVRSAADPAAYNWSTGWPKVTP